MTLPARSEEKQATQTSQSSRSLPSSSTSTASTAHEDMDDHTSPGSLRDLEKGLDGSFLLDTAKSATAGTHGLNLQPAKSATTTTASSRGNALSRALSRVRTSDSIPPSPPPDGGRQAWLTAVLTHLVIFNTWVSVILFHSCTL